MKEWNSYIKKKGFELSFGYRIHGSIVPMLSGVPTVIYTSSSCTGEMIEYFDFTSRRHKSDIIYINCSWHGLLQSEKG